MRRTLAVATIAAHVGIGVPGASASHVTSDCWLDAIAQQDVTGDVHEGAAYGYATATGDTLAVRCVVLVNHVEAASTPYGPTASHVAATAGRITFTAGGTDIVEICSEVTTTAHGARLYCPDRSPDPFPAPWVYQLIDAAVGTAFETLDPALAVMDAQLCPVLGSLSPGTPPVTFDPTGDVYLDGSLFWDCPPFES